MTATQPPTQTPLPDLAVLQCQGADAVAFLHGQLSNDIANMPPTEARLAAYCNAKGRVLATLVVWREPEDAHDTCYALVKADIADALVKRLSMFVLRAKVTIRVVARTVIGEVAALAQDAPPAWHLVRNAGYMRIQAPSADPTHSRCWCIGPITETAPNPDASNTDTQQHAWHAADIAAGLPWISAAHQALYIPQTLNLDLLGAISFTKGCFPGQEVVARSHYRGTVKRRMAYGTATHGQITLGMDVFHATGDAHPCGRVINLARIGPMWHALLEVQLADVPAADFRLGGVDGAPVTLHALPYAI